MDAHVKNLGLGAAKYAGVVLLLVVFGFPFYWMFVSGIKPSADIVQYPPQIIPSTVTLANYERLFEDTKYLLWLRNSLIVSIGNVVLSVVISTLAGYGLTRYAIPYKKYIAMSFIFAYMFPPLMLGIPYYVVFDGLGLLNSYLGLVIAHAAVTIPFTTWLMWQFFQTVPISWEESAWVFGASRFKSMIEIATPGALPGIIASAIFAFGISWGDYTFALILVDDPNMTLLTVGIDIYTQGAQVYWDLIMTGATLLVLPPLILVFTLNRYILAGFSISGFD
ncbi:carbohydrate ABC transporter permease [Halorarum halobium]|uniref:carbohydrate ABC transporter permease n=1 Tax=Halorarum halobium TaxID=3075121 RepID=UPI0028AF5233|nr:carbohydrate ABC transporter permease [Halobaculum sp. XH14]